jgi:hypothetical protein
MHRYRSTIVVSFAALSSLLHATSLCAQPADPNAAATEYRKAYAAIAKEDWPQARELLLKVWNGKKTYDVAASLGQVEFKLDHYAAAARYMAFALVNVAPSEKPEFIDRLKKGLREVRLRVGSIRVTVSEPDAEVSTDDDAFGISPLAQEVFLEPGRHVLIARKGDRTAKADVVTKAGEGFEVTLTLPAEPAPLAPTSGLGVAGSSPASGTDTASPADRGTGQTRSVVPVIVGGAVAVAAAATGIALRVSANGSYDDAEQARRQNGEHGCLNGSAGATACESQQEAVRSGDTKTNISTATFAVAGAAVVATAAYWFWPRQKATHAALVPMVSLTASGGFFGVSSRF